MKRAIALVFAASVLAEPALAKDTQFWNLTSSTVKSLELARAGTSAFGPNQCVNDPDGAVDHDERLKVTGVTTARLRRAADARRRTQLHGEGRRGRDRQAVLDRGQGSRRLREIAARARTRGRSPCRIGEKGRAVTRSPSRDWPTH